MEGLKAQPGGTGSEGSVSPGEGLVSEPGNPGLAFLPPEPQGAHVRPQSGPALSPTAPPSTLREGKPPRTTDKRGATRASAGTLGGAGS